MREMINVNIDMYTIDKLLKGAVDMHLHPAPSGGIPLRIDALEAARQARQAGMKGIVLKSQQYPTAPLANLVKQLVPEIEVIGSICLEYQAGGLNVDALKESAQLNARMVWMPTNSAANSISKMKALGIPLEGEGISILDSKGQLVPEIGKILSLVKKYDMVLASGHLTPAETFALIDEARRMGIWKLVITHPTEEEFVTQPISLEDQQRLVKMGAFIEHTFVTLLPTEFSKDPVKKVQQIRAVGAEHCIMSGSLGEGWNLLPVEGMRLFIATLLRKGMTPEEIELMVKVNPAKLLGLD
jgi:hypothetical protein